MSELVNFYKGLEADLPQTIVPGRILFTEDTGKLYIETSVNNTPVRKLINQNTAGSPPIRYIGYPTSTLGIVGRNTEIFNVEFYDLKTFEEVSDNTLIFDQTEFVILVVSDAIQNAYLRFTGMGYGLDRIFQFFGNEYPYGESDYLLVTIIPWDEEAWDIHDYSDEELFSIKSVNCVGECMVASDIRSPFQTAALNGQGLTSAAGKPGLVPSYPANAPTTYVLTGSGWVAPSSLGMQWQQLQ